MTARTKALVSAIVIGAAVGAAYPFIDVALSCRAPDSEACVWGKAYLPLSLAISIPILGGVVAAVAYALWAWRSARSRRAP